MTGNERRHRWIEERAYFLWLDSGMQHGQTFAYWSQAELDYNTFFEDKWRQWNMRAVAIGNVPVPALKDPKPLFRGLIEALLGRNVGIHFRQRFIMISLPSNQEWPGNPDQMDWRAIDLPDGADTPAQLDRNIGIVVRRYTGYH